MRILEGNLTVYEDEGSVKSGEKSIENLLATKVWGKIDESVNSVVDSITLEDIVDEYRKLNGNQSLMFYI